MHDLVAANVKRLRDERNLSQEQLAALAGIHRLTVVDLEAGRSENPGLQLLTRVAGALGVTVPALLTSPSRSRRRT